MTDMYQWQSLNYRLLTWNRHMKNVVGFKMFDDSGVTAQHRNKLSGENSSD